MTISADSKRPRIGCLLDDHWNRPSAVITVAVVDVAHGRFETRVMFSSNEGSFPIIALSAYLLSVLWLVPGAGVVAASRESVVVLAAAVGAPTSVVDAIVVANVTRPLLAVAMLLSWLAAWGVLSAASAALLLRWTRWS